MAVVLRADRPRSAIATDAEFIDPRLCINFIEARNESPITRGHCCCRTDWREPRADNGSGDHTGEPSGAMEQNTSGDRPHPRCPAGDDPPTRSFAIMHAAIYDAVNVIDGTHKPYLVRLSASHFAS